MTAPPGTRNLKVAAAILAASLASFALATVHLAPLHWLLDTRPFEIRSRCGPGWSDTLRAVYVAANVAIVVSYFAIPAMLMVLYRSKRQELPAPWMLALFANFILFCGLTHLSDVVVFWWAPYRLYAAIFVAAGLASVAAAATLPAVIKKLVMMPGREYVHALNNRLQVEVAEKEVLRLEALDRERATAEINRVLQARIEVAQARIDRLEHDRASSEWWAGQKAALLEIQGRFRDLANVGHPGAAG